MRKMNKKGFTLTEILIVLVVAGILLALILPNVLKAIERGNITAHESNLNTGQVAVFMCFTENRDWDDCDTEAELIAGNFLDVALVNPISGDGYAVQASNLGDGGFAYCSDTVVATVPENPGC